MQATTAILFRTGRLASLSGVVLGILGGCLQTWAAAGLEWSANQQPTEWTLTLRDKPVMVYSSDPQQYKPFIKALYTTKGQNVLRNAPFDHLHHHALMYGIRVNDVNFWEEIPGAGVQKAIRTEAPRAEVSAAGLPQATLVQLLHWLPAEHAFLPNTNAPTLLVERRTITVTLDEARDEVAVHWKSRFEVGTRTNVVTLSGANYHGLGMRFPQELDSVAHHFTAAGKLDLSGNRQDVSAHDWEAVLFDTPGNPVTVAVVGHPSNPRGNAKFFAMKTPFAYLSATQGLDQQPLVYRKGEQFELNYLVTVYPSVKTAEALSQRSGQWAKSKP